MVSISGMTVSIKTDLWFPITGQQGHGSRNIQIPPITVINSSGEGIVFSHTDAVLAEKLFPRLRKLKTMWEKWRGEWFWRRAECIRLWKFRAMWEK